MSKKKLETFADMLGGYDPEEYKEQEKGVTEIDLSKLVPFENHPFRLYQDKQLDNMVESIKEFGVMIPIIVRKKENDIYEILSGHNRVNAAKLVGLTTIPAVIHDNLSDDDAILIVTETNFMQRSLDEMLPSEKAKAFEMEMQALKRQGKKTSWFFDENDSENQHEYRDESTSTTELSKWRSDEAVGERNNISREMVRQYRRLNYLTTPLLKMVDEHEIIIKAAVELSYLKVKEQNMVEEALLAGDDYKVDWNKAKLLRTYSKNGKLDEENITAILSGEIDKKKKAKKPAAFKLKPKIVSKYFKPEQNQAEIEEVIDKALAFYFETLMPGKEAIHEQTAETS